MENMRSRWWVSQVWQSCSHCYCRRFVSVSTIMKFNTHTHTHTHLNLLHKFLSGYKTDLVYYWCLEMIEVNTTIRETTGWFCLFILKDSDSHGLKGRSCSVVRLYGSRAAGLWHHILCWTHKYLRMGWWPRRNASCWQCVKLSWTNKLLVSLLSTGGARIQRKESWF